MRPRRRYRVRVSVDQELTSSSGIRLAYSRSGAGGRAIVLVHGWCCDRTYLEPQFAHFSPRYAVVSVDLRGHGRSGAAADGSYAIEDFADDLAEVWSHAGLSDPVVVGHSMGGLVALECAARGTAAGAVLVDPAPIVNQRGKDYFLRSVLDVAADEDGLWRSRFAERLFLPTDRARRADIVVGMSSAPTDVAAAALRGMGEYDGAAALGRARVPMMVIGAGPVADPEGLHPAYPQIVLEHTEGSGHFNQLEVPDQVNRLIERFLADNGLGC